MQEQKNNTICRETAAEYSVSPSVPPDVSFEFSEEEAETAKSLAMEMFSVCQEYDKEKLIAWLTEDTDINLMYYASFGEFKTNKELTDFFTNSDENMDFSMLHFPETTSYAVTDVKITKEDDAFWSFLSEDSQIWQDLQEEENADIHISDHFTIDKCYQVIIGGTDEQCPENNETDIRVYVARVNGEWKIETIFNFLYEFYSVSSPMPDSEEEPQFYKKGG